VVIEEGGKPRLYNRQINKYFTEPKGEPTMKNESSNIQSTRPIVTRKRIGSTTYEVNSYFNPAAKETLEQKILRILKNDLTSGLNRGIINMSQTVGLPERSSA
jgi:hypothetical protein